MNRKIVLAALMSIALVSIVVIAPAFQTSTGTLATTREESSPPTLEERLLSLAEWLPESIKSHLTKIASMRSELGPRMVRPQQVVAANITVERYEWVWLIVDKSFAPVKVNWEVISDPTPIYYIADTVYVVWYYIDIAEDTDPGTVILTDTWKRGMAWGIEGDITKPYYLLGYETNIPGAGPEDYNPATGVLSIPFDPEPGYIEYGIVFAFLAKAGFVNQFISKPSVRCILSPTTTPPLVAGGFYDMWLRMRGFKVRGFPLEVYLWMEVPGWQSTENGVYIKNMDPQIELRLWWGADPPDVPGPTGGGAEWAYNNYGLMPHVDPPFPEHWIQVAFEKSELMPKPNWGSFLYHGEVNLYYYNKGFGIVTGDTPQLTLSPEDRDISVTTGLEGNVISWLEYYFQEPKPTLPPSL